MMRKPIWVTFFLMLILAATPFASRAAPFTAQASPMKGNWRAEYYDNPSLSGQPRISRVESQLSQDWGNGSPALEIPADHFSARWTATLNFKKGTYLLFLTVDDGARVWLNGKLIIDAWNSGPQNKLETSLRIEQEGNYEVQVAYFEKTGSAYIVLESLQLGDEDDIIGAWQAEYFNNKDLAGTPVLARSEGCVCYSWDYDSPDIKVTRDNFSARWTRSIFLNRAGAYTFRIQHDDGMRIYVDGKIIYDSWHDQSVTYQVRQIPLKEGYRTFVVEYYEHTGLAVAQVSIDQDPGDYGGDDPGPVGVIVDNTSSNFEWGGPSDHRFSSGGGYGDNFYWTYTNGSAKVNYGLWHAPIGSAGNYEVFAYIPGSHATTKNARYFVKHFGKLDERRIDQSNYRNEWVSLGTYYFGGNGDEFVVLNDNCEEPIGSTQVAFDALKFTKR
jgi:hypothetical protein